MAKESMEWLDAIASRAKVDINRVESVLTARHIVPTPVLPAPRRMKLLSISFGGEKQGVEDDGPYTFEWKNLSEGLWGMMSDRNLRGKSSVIEIVRWLMRGSPSSNLQDDVKAWIHNASLRFDLDGFEYEVRVDCSNGSAGVLTRKSSPTENATVLASFSSEKQFEMVMSDFFLRTFSMEGLATWRESDTEEKTGHAVIHGWPALSGAMFIGTNYDVVLGDLPATSGTQARLIQMYLGVPWISTLATALAAQKLVTSSNELEARRRSQGAQAKQARVKEIELSLAEKREALKMKPSDEVIQNELSQLSGKYSETKRREKAMQERLDREILAEQQSNAAYLQDRRDIQAHKDSTAAGSIFRLLDPTCCPRCDHEIDQIKKKKEAINHSCSVCGESISSSEDADILLKELEARIKASKSAFDKASKDRKLAEESLDILQTELESIQTKTQALTEQLGSFESRRLLSNEIAILEGRLEEASFDSGTDVVVDDEAVVLKAIVTETDLRSKAVRDEYLEEVSTSLLRFAKSFGMHSLSKAQLRGNANLMLVKGGADTSFSKVTKGERLRLKVATVLAMIEVGERRGVGRHPGLIMIDSPAAQEVAPEDLRELFSGLMSIRGEIPHLQIFVAGMTSKAMCDHIPPSNRKEALNGGYLW
jgi:transcription elongation factor Elf1